MSTFYSTSTLTTPFTREDVLAGHVIRLSPALITITDGRVDSIPAADLRADVIRTAHLLLDHGVHSLHVDVNFDDYGGFAGPGPDRNAAIFTPDLVGELVEIAGAQGGFVTLHLLTNRPEHHLRDFEQAPPAAICFQLDVVSGDPARLQDLIAQIRALGACASPVIETVGTDRLAPLPEIDVRRVLEPHLPQIGMLTLQAAGTAARSNAAAGTFARDRTAAYMTCLQPGFKGTIQIQGGITVETIGAAVQTGAEFLVAGTQIFHHRDGLTPPQVIQAMLYAAAEVLQPR